MRFRAKVKNSKHPSGMKEWMGGGINRESVEIRQVLTKFGESEEKQIKETIVWHDVSRKIRKYTPFVHMDLLKAKNIVLKVFTN